MQDGFSIEFLEGDGRSQQGVETFHFQRFKGGKIVNEATLKTHQYGEIYKVPGLYEFIFYETLQCRSHTFMVGMLEKALRQEENNGLLKSTFLDFGAGTGLVGEELRKIGVERIIGLDILPRAMEAYQTAGGTSYEIYLIDNMSNPKKQTVQTIMEYGPHVAITVSALGFNDVPAVAFNNVLSFLAPNDLFAFNLCSKILENGQAEYNEVISALEGCRKVEFLDKQKYVHRYSPGGKEILYHGFVGKIIEPISFNRVE